jgi:hypothetical protein
MSAGDLAIIKIVDAGDGRRVLVSAEFQPPIKSELKEFDSPRVNAAAVALGAIGNWAAGLEHDEGSDDGPDDDVG